MGFWKDLAEGAANVGSFGAYGLAKDALSQDEVHAPDIDKASFQRAGVQQDIAQANEQANAARQYARDGVNQADANARASNQAAALGYEAARGDAYAARDQGQQWQQNQGTARLGYQQTANAMQNRANPTLNTANADQARAQQYAALGGVAAQAGQGADTSALRNFYQGPAGPSAAERQLQGSSEQNMANSLALARSGRNGMNPAAERQAMFQNAATAAQTNQQLGVLRAQEEATNRGLNLNAMTAEQQAIAAGRNAQLQALGLQQQTLSGIGQGALNQSVAQANTALAGRGQNDQAALNYDQLSQQAAALGLQGGLGYGGLANQSLANGGQYQIGMTNAGTGQQQAGNQRYATDTASGLSYQGMANSISEQERQAQIQYEALKAGVQMQANQANAEYDAQRDAAAMNMVGSTFGAMLFSDIRAKKNIRGEDIASQYAALGGKDYGLDYKDYGLDYREGPGESAHRASRTAGRDFYAFPGTNPRALDRGDPYDMRPVTATSYEYRDPNAPGAAPGRQYGGMAQDLEQSPATAPAVVDMGDGQKGIDTGRLSLTTASAVGQQQRRQDVTESELEALRAQVEALGGGPSATRRAGARRYASTGGL